MSRTSVRKMASDTLYITEKMKEKGYKNLDKAIESDPDIKEAWNSFYQSWKESYE